MDESIVRGDYLKLVQENARNRDKVASRDLEIRRHVEAYAALQAERDFEEQRADEWANKFWAMENERDDALFQLDALVARIDEAIDAI